METTEKSIDLRRLWWVLKKYFLWILILAILGAVGAGVYTKLTSETTYTTRSVFLVGAGGSSSSLNNSATTEYYEIQKAIKDAEVIADNIAQATTVTAVMKNGNLGAGEEPTLKEVMTVMRAVSANLSKDDSRLIVLSVKTSSPSESVKYARVFEEQLPLYVKTSLRELNASLTPIDRVDDKYVVKSDDPFNPDKESYSVAPDGIPLTRNIALGGLGLLALSFLAFFVYDALDNTVRSAENLLERFPTIPVVGQIPQWTTKKLTRRQKRMELQGKLRDYEDKLISKSNSFSVSEAFRSLRTNINYVVGGKTTVVGITSVKSGECKSVVASNLALSYAQLNKKVLLIEADMRLPAIHDIFDISPLIGLPEVLAGIERDYHNCLFNVNEFLSILPVGTQTPPNPAELLASDATDELFWKLRGEFDLIIVDLPPFGTVSDASIVSRVVDQYLIATRVETSNSKNLANVLRDMERLNMKVCGFVISGLDMGNKKRRGNYYYDNYGQRRTRVETMTQDIVTEEYIPD